MCIAVVHSHEEVDDENWERFLCDLGRLLDILDSEYGLCMMGGWD